MSRWPSHGSQSKQGGIERIEQHRWEAGTIGSGPETEGIGSYKQYPTFFFDFHSNNIFIHCCSSRYPAGRQTPFVFALIYLGFSCGQFLAIVGMVDQGKGQKGEGRNKASNHENMQVLV